MGRKNKVRCLNCGTVVKDDDKSCPICHMVIERPEEEIEEEKEFVIKQEFPIGKVIMLVFILVGIILTIKGIVEYQNVEYCTADDCGFKSLFIAGVGIVLIISSSVALARDEFKSKKA